MTQYPLSRGEYVVLSDIFLDTDSLTHTHTHTHTNRERERERERFGLEFPLFRKNTIKIAIS